MIDGAMAVAAEIRAPDRNSLIATGVEPIPHHHSRNPAHLSNPPIV